MSPILQMRKVSLSEVSQLVLELLGLEAAGSGSSLGSLLWLGDHGNFSSEDLRLSGIGADETVAC